MGGDGVLQRGQSGRLAWCDAVDGHSLNNAQDPRRLRVGLNLLYLRPGVVGGTETYARGLLDALAAVAPECEFVVFVNRSAGDWALPSGFSRTVCPVGPRQSTRYLYEQIGLPLLLARRRIDVLHSLAYVAPVVLPCAGVVTVHDLNYRAPSHRMHLIRRLTLATFVSAAVRSSDAVITDSRFIRDELATVFPVSAGKLHVVHAAPATRTDRGATGERHADDVGPYFLAFSSVSPNKNLGRLLDAHAMARAAGLAHSLVLVGHRPPGVAVETPGVVWTGYVTDARLHELMRGAVALLYPSLYEGFGLPVLEAMQAGLAVACSRHASLPEVAADAALYFDAEDVASIAGSIRRLATDAPLRTELVARGRARASQFSWERAASETLAVYHSAVAARSGRSRA